MGSENFDKSKVHTSLKIDIGHTGLEQLNHFASLNSTNNSITFVFKDLKDVNAIKESLDSSS